MKIKNKTVQNEHQQKQSPYEHQQKTKWKEHQQKKCKWASTIKNKI